MRIIICHGVDHYFYGDRSKMRYRIYSTDNTAKEFVKEIEIIGKIYRICDDHGRVVFGMPWPDGKKIIKKLLNTKTKEPSYYE